MNFYTTLREHNMKATPQRVDILSSLYSRGHANIDEIHQDLKVDNPEISLTTIYRNINEMVKNSLVSEVKLPKQKQKYEIIKESHTHLACISCGSVIDAFLNIENLIQNVESNYSCRVIDEAIVLNTVCKSCLKEEGRF